MDLATAVGAFSRCPRGKCHAVFSEEACVLLGGASLFELRYQEKGWVGWMCFAGRGHWTTWSHALRGSNAFQTEDFLVAFRIVLRMVILVLIFVLFTDFFICIE